MVWYRLARVLFSTNSGSYVITTCTLAGGDGESGTVIGVTSWMEYSSFFEVPLFVTLV